MSTDLFLGKTKRNFARDLEPSLPVSDEVTISFSPDEQVMLTRIASLRLKADSGDRASKKQLVVMAKKVAALKVRARKGDAKAKRSLLVLRESGVFNETQTLTLGWSLFKSEDQAVQKARMEKFTSDLKTASKPEDLAKLSEMATYNQAIKNKLGELARSGDKNALRVAAYVATNKKDSKEAIVGGSDERAAAIQQEIRRLRQKNPKTAADESALEQLTERLTRIEAMSGIGYGPTYPSSAWNRNPGKRQMRRARKLAQIKARAASGDQRAVARLQQMQQKLATRAASGDPQAVALLQQIQLPTGAYVPPQGSPYAPSPALPPTATPTNSPSYIPPAYTPTTYTPPAYQPAYVPPYYQDADGNYYQTQPQPGQSQPTVDVFVGQRSRRRDEEVAAEREDRGDMGWYGNSFVGGSFVGGSFVGNAIPHDNYRVAVMKAAVKSAGGGRPSTKDYFKAKSVVDKVIGKSGITIYMPGAKPGRRTI